MIDRKNWLRSRFRRSEYWQYSIVRAFKRLKEAGIRKVCGAFRKNLILQFIGESFFTALVSGLFSVLVMDLLLAVMAGKRFLQILYGISF